MADPQAAGKMEQKRQARESKRQSKNEMNNKNSEGKDVFSLAQDELNQDAEEALEGHSKKAGGGRKQRQDDGEDEDDAKMQGEDDAGCLENIIAWLLTKPAKPPQPWNTYRAEEIETNIRKRDTFPAGFGRKFWYNRIRIKKTVYWGDRNGEEERDMRGVCVWPDPPVGGGESYYGLFQHNQPHGFGIFRWFEGDMYLGEWKEGALEGYGVYVYSKNGLFPGDRYEGAYHASLRQGTGIYRYAGERGGVYVGEWVKGMMHGCGIMMYNDGEYYVGLWKKDKKSGLGVYMWGKGSGEVAGDKYEGFFENGVPSGMGRTKMKDGGFHKGRYLEGRMHGFGVMQTWDGYEYQGKWHQDELHGDVMASFVFGNHEASTREVQIYSHGNLQGTRDFDPTKDWSEIEAQAFGEARAGETAGDEARAAIPIVAERARRAKISEGMARDQADEARYYAKEALRYQKFLKAWWGLKKWWVVDED